jgi:hypothetical protein
MLTDTSVDPLRDQRYGAECDRTDAGHRVCVTPAPSRPRYHNARLCAGGRRLAADTRGDNSPGAGGSWLALFDGDWATISLLYCLTPMIFSRQVAHWTLLALALGPNRELTGDRQWDIETAPL